MGSKTDYSGCGDMEKRVGRMCGGKAHREGKYGGGGMGMSMAPKNKNPLQTPEPPKRRGPSKSTVTPKPPQRRGPSKSTVTPKPPQRRGPSKSTVTPKRRPVSRMPRGPMR